MDKKNSKLFEELQLQKSYQELIKQLPEDERPFIEKYIKELLEGFEQSIDII